MKPPKPLGLFVPLDVDFAADEKIVDSSVTAEHVFIRALALCKRTLSDGVVTSSQLRRECEKLDPLELGGALEELVSVGLFVRLGDGRMSIASWLKRNPSKGDLVLDRDNRAKRSELGNHRRWHEAKGVTDPSCELCFPRSIPISHKESLGESHKESHNESIIGKGSHSEGIGKSEGRHSERKPPPERGDNAEAVAAEILRNAGFATKTPTAGETQTVARALARGWPADYLRNLGTEAAVKAHSNPKGYIDSALNRCANHELPPPPKPDEQLITCPDCRGDRFDYNDNGDLIDVDCQRCDNKRRIPLDQTADY